MSEHTWHTQKLTQGAKHRSQNINCRAGQAALKIDLPLRHTSTCHATLLNKDELHCEDCQKTLLAERRKLPLKFTCPAGTSTCHATLLNKDELHCEDCQKNITCRAGQARLLFCLPDCHFLPKSFATCNGASVLLHAVTHRHEVQNEDLNY